MPINRIFVWLAVEIQGDRLGFASLQVTAGNPLKDYLMLNWNADSVVEQGPVHFLFVDVVFCGHCGSSVADTLS